MGWLLGGKRETFQGLSGIGDLMVTCFSRHSRNRAVGERLGKGERLADIIASMNMVAEGVPTTYSAYECARRSGVETPIIDQMRAQLDGTPTAAGSGDQSHHPRTQGGVGRRGGQSDHQTGLRRCQGAIIVSCVIPHPPRHLLQVAAC